MEIPRFSQRLRVSEDSEVAESDAPDQLSELPDSLILEILSLLQMKDVVRTTILSKRWKNRWITVPCLDFWYHSYSHNYPRFISGALAQWKGPKLLKFTLASNHDSNDLDSWLSFAIEKEAEELQLRNWDYFLPQRLYSCSWIKKLSFHYLEMKIDGNVQWDCLKILTIAGSNCLSPDALNRILCGAPQLEELVFAVSAISENFTIRSTSLKTLSIGSEPYCYEIVTVYDRSVSVWAPNLLTLRIYGKFDGDAGCLLDVPSLTNAGLHFYHCGGIYSDDFPGCYRAYFKVIQSVLHVENVSISNWCIQFLLYMKMKGVVVQFSNAKSLNLFPDFPGANIILDILQMFPNLMFLTVKSLCFQYAQICPPYTKSTTASVDNLKTIEIGWYEWDSEFYRVIEIMLGNAHLLEKMVLRLGENDDKALILAQAKVLKMRRSSPTAEVIIIKS